MTKYNLQRFTQAQQPVYADALTQIEAGRKRTHWMWFIFPLLAGLGKSETAQYFALSGRHEAEAYLAHPLLGERLVTISRALLAHTGRSAHTIFGYPDELKLKSSMTLFTMLPGADPVFQQVLDAFFNGEPDEVTIHLLQP